MLLNELATPHEFGKDLQKKLRAEAKNLNITVAAGLSWPAFLKDGVWIGGSFLPRGGEKAEDEFDLPIRIRITGLLKWVEQELKKLIEAGHTVLIGKGNSTDRSFAVEATKDTNITKMLLQRMEETTPPRGKSWDKKAPTVVWYVSTPSEIKNSLALKISFYGLSAYAGHAAPYSKLDKPITTFYAVGAAKRVKQLEKKLKNLFTALWKIHAAPALLTKVQLAKKHKELSRELFQLLGELNPALLKVIDPHKDVIPNFGISTGVVNPKTMLHDKEGKLFDILERHLS